MERFQNFFLALLCFISLAGPAHARSSVPLVDLENQAISAASGKALTLDEIGLALRRAAPVRGWSIEEIAPGQAVATLVVRGKHTIKVDVTYSEKAISFKYKDSVNMKYETDEEGKPVIHPFYMKWVHNLMSDIRIELARY